MKSIIKKKWLKKPKYRHWMSIAIVILIYAIWKAYVLYTPSPHDDDIPDKVKDAVLILVYDPNTDTEFEDAKNA